MDIDDAATVDESAAIEPITAPATAMSRWQMPVFDTPEESAHGGLHTAEQLDQIEVAAYQEGLRRGHAEGYAAGHHAMQQEVERLRALVDHLQRPLAHLDEAVERMLLDTACAIARRLVLAELQQAPEAIERIAREALDALPAYVRDVRLHLHAEDAQLIGERLPAPPEAHSFKIVVDDALDRGECRVVTESTQLDTRLDARLSALSSNLIGEPT